MELIRDPAGIRAICGHRPPRDGCQLCRLANQLEGRESAAPPPAPCAHRGDPLTASECVALGLPPARSWAPCGHPDQPKGVYVCPCRGCGPTCSGYAASMFDDGPGVG